jgi:branched-chain amino acid transport system permease protein
VKVGGFALSAAFAGAAGATMAVRWTYVDPAAVFNPFIGLQTVLMAIVGGAMSLAGPVLAAIVFSLLTELLRLRFPYVYLIVLGTLLIVAVLHLPRGLAGLWSGHERA